MKNAVKLILLVCFLITYGFKSYSQIDAEDRALLKQIAQQDQKAADAIAMYPHDVRQDIFIACTYPEVVVRLSSMQAKTKDEFTEMLSSYNRDEQEKIWNLTRYPGLIGDLAAGHRKSDDELNTILANYPPEIHKTAIEESFNNYDLLVRIDQRNHIYEMGFENMIAGYPPEVIQAFRDLIKLPEVLNILNDNMQLTVVIGDIYRKDPNWILHKSDSVNLVMTQKNNQDADEWKQSMNNDPDARQEYIQAAQEYAQDNGYQQDDYNAPLTPDVTDYYTYSYNWWFGYPYWYPYEYWDPYPYWYDWGFYYGPGGNAVFFGQPSWYFMDWYFYYPEHHHHYYHLSDHYYDYYTRHRDNDRHNNIVRVVGDWHDRNRDVITHDWDDKSKRPQLFKEYGQMESSREKYNKANPNHPVERNEYLQKNQDKYPTIKTAIANRTPEEQKQLNKPVQQTQRQEPIKKPVVKVPDYYKAPPAKTTEQNKGDNKQQTQPVQPKHDYTPKPVQNSPKTTQNQNQIRNAQQYHQNTWQQIQPTQHTPSYSPPPSNTPRQSPPPSGGNGNGGGKRK
jgi:hypothetical protein